MPTVAVWPTPPRGVSVPAAVPVDCLSIMPHPDDAELIAGGLLLTCAAQGLRCAAVELTCGEAGTRGTVAERLGELRAATQVLKLIRREVLDLPDGRLQADAATVDRVASLIRFHRPRVIVTTHWEDHHPDHEACHAICRKAAWRANMGKFVDGRPRHRTTAVLGGMSRMGMAADLVVDIGPVFAGKLKAIRCFKSQLHATGGRERSEPATRIGSKDFLAMIEGQHRYYGQQAGCELGEPFALQGPVPVLTRSLRDLF